MQANATANLSDRLGVARPTSARPVRTFVLGLLLPIAMLGVAMYNIEHDFYFASLRFQFELGVKHAVHELGGSPVRALSLVAIGALGGLLLLIRSNVPLELQKGIVWLIALLSAFVVLSACWADDPMLSIKRSVQPVLLIVAAMGFAKHWRPRQLCLFTAFFTAGVLLLGILAVTIEGIDLQGQAYRFGGTLHPNIQAVNCAALCLASLALLRGPKGDDGQHTIVWRWLLPLAFGLVFLYLTRSRTTTAALLLSFGLFCWMGLKLKGKLIAVYVLIVAAAYLGVLLIDGSRETRGWLVGTIDMGRKADASQMNSLTGRIPIWQRVSSDISNRPMLGYGYGGFWTPQRIVDYSTILDWEFDHAHSAYLETLLNIGAIGLCLGLLVIVFVILAAIRSYNRTGDSGYQFVAALLFMALVHGMLDSNFVVVGMAPMLAALCIAMVALHPFQSQEPANPGVE